MTLASSRLVVQGETLHAHERDAIEFAIQTLPNSDPYHMWALLELLDPSTGRPAWTGLIGVTAVGDTALEAETLSKMALLLGPAGARDVLAAKGGIAVQDDGSVEAVGPVAWDRPFAVAS